MSVACYTICWKCYQLCTTPESTDKLRSDGCIDPHDHRWSGGNHNSVVVTDHIERSMNLFVYKNYQLLCMYINKKNEVGI